MDISKFSKEDKVTIYKEIIRELAFQACGMIATASDENILQFAEGNNHFVSLKIFGKDEYGLSLSLSRNTLPEEEQVTKKIENDCEKITRLKFIEVK